MEYNITLNRCESFLAVCREMENETWKKYTENEIKII